MTIHMFLRRKYPQFTKLFCYGCEQGVFSSLYNVFLPKFCVWCVWGGGVVYFWEFGDSSTDAMPPKVTILKCCFILLGCLRFCSLQFQSNHGSACVCVYFPWDLRTNFAHSQIWTRQWWSFIHTIVIMYYMSINKRYAINEIRTSC